jgi:homoserine kinase type II
MVETRDLLTRYPPDCHPVAIQPLDNAGGMSGAQFWRITAPRGTLILRRWPTEHPKPDRLRLIHAVIHHAAQTIDFLPVPITTHDKLSFVEAAGRLWELAPWMPGTANYELAPSDKKLHAAMTALAQFHIAVADFRRPPELAATLLAPSPTAIPRRLARLREVTPQRIEELNCAITDAIWPEFAPLARQFLTALPDAVPRAIAKLEPLANISLPLQPCLRDIWHDHVLFTGNAVTGLIDFGAVDIDTPATDIARLLGSLVHSDRAAWQSGIAAYSTSRPLSTNESLAVCAINAANPVLAGCNWIRWIYIDRRHFEDPLRIVGRFQRLAAQLPA